MRKLNRTKFAAPLLLSAAGLVACDSDVKNETASAEMAEVTREAKTRAANIDEQVAEQDETRCRIEKNSVVLAALAETREAEANLEALSGTEIDGEVELREQPDGVKVRVKLDDTSPGPKLVELTEAKDCDSTSLKGYEAPRDVIPASMAKAGGSQRASAGSQPAASDPDEMTSTEAMNELREMARASDKDQRPSVPPKHGIIEGFDAEEPAPTLGQAVKQPQKVQGGSEPAQGIAKAAGDRSGALARVEVGTGHRARVERMIPGTLLPNTSRSLMGKTVLVYDLGEGASTKPIACGVIEED